jgi:hypothetical protein
MKYSDRKKNDRPVELRARSISKSVEDQENTGLVLVEHRRKFYSPGIKEMQGFLWMSPDCSP